jgi:hypothetical protein
MNEIHCPFCRRINRAGARHCAGCGQDMQVINAPNLARKAANVAGQAAQVAAPVARQAAAASWAQGRRSASWLRRVLTLGGRTAYSELFNPEPVLSGWIVSPVQTRTVQTPIAISFLVFVLFVALSWLIIFLPGAWPNVALIVWLLVLLILNFAGAKRPFFTMMTLQRLLGRQPQTQVAEFYLQELNGNRRFRVDMMGAEHPILFPTGTFVQVYGIEESGQTAIHAWWLTAISQDGQTQTPIRAPRLIPLSAALFLPLLLTTLIWLIKLLWLLFSAT